MGIETWIIHFRYFSIFYTLSGGDSGGIGVLGRGSGLRQLAGGSGRWSKEMERTSTGKGSLEG